MLKKLSCGYVLITLTILVLGCTSMDSLEKERGYGSAEIFEVPIEKVWSELPSVLLEAGLKITKEKKEEGYILAESPTTLTRWGEKVAIYVESINDGLKTRVEVVSKKVYEPTALSTNWEPIILSRLYQKLK